MMVQFELWCGKPPRSALVFLSFLQSVTDAVSEHFVVLKIDFF